MIYLHDLNGYKGDFGSSNTIQFFADVARENGLEELDEFLANGSSIKAVEIAEEIDSMDWPEVDGYDELAVDIVGTLKRCSENVVFLVN